MELLKAYLKERRLTLAAFLLFVGVFAVSFALYGLPLAAVGYPAGLCVLLGACLAAWDYGRTARRHKALKRLREAGEAVLLDLPAMTTVEGADCAAVVETLRRHLRRRRRLRQRRYPRHLRRRLRSQRHRQRRSRRHIPWTRYCGRCTAERRRQTARRRLPRRYTAARGCWNGCWTTRRSWRPIWTR